jgi:hypothetical protein
MCNIKDGKEQLMALKQAKVRLDRFDITDLAKLLEKLDNSGGAVNGLVLMMTDEGGNEYTVGVEHVGGDVRHTLTFTTLVPSE